MWPSTTTSCPSPSAGIRSARCTGASGPSRGPLPGIYQADIDIIGDGKLDITNEAEIPSIIYQTFSTLGLKRFQIV